MKITISIPIRSDFQTPSQLWFAMFRLNELLMSLRKLFENASASEFLRDILGIASYQEQK